MELIHKQMSKVHILCVMVVGGSVCGHYLLFLGEDGEVVFSYPRVR